MITQCVLTQNSGLVERIYWLEHDNRNGVFVRQGDMVALYDEVGGQYYVKQVLGGYADNVQLPPGARSGRIRWASSMAAA